MPWARDLGLVMVLCGTACHEAADEEIDDTGTSSSGAVGEDGSSSSDSGSTTGEVVYASLEERPCPPDSTLTWENFGGGYVLTYCTTCHHSALPADMRQLAPIAINLETVELVRALAPRVWQRAADQNQTMPPVGAPAADDRALLGEWLACGAPTNADLGMD